MSLLTPDYALAARPGRSLFSFAGNEMTRARLPDFDNMASLSDFVRRLFIYRFDRAVFVQFRVGASLLLIFALIVIVLIARRKRQRSFWIVRFVPLRQPINRKSDVRRVIVPNVLLCSTFFHLLYWPSTIALLFEHCRWFEHQGVSPNNMLFWLAFQATPLMLAVAFAIWGSLLAIAVVEPIRKANTSSANVSATQNGSVVESGPMRRLRQTLRQHAGALHFAILIVGVLIVGLSISLPAIMANARYMQALHRQETWLSVGGDEASTQMVQEAQAIWYDLLRAVRIVMIAMSLWPAYGLLALIILLVTYTRLLYKTHDELRNVRAKRRAITLLAMNIVLNDADVLDARRWAKREWRARRAQKRRQVIGESSNPSVRAPDTRFLRSLRPLRSVTPTMPSDSESEMSDSNDRSAGGGGGSGSGARKLQAFLQSAGPVLAPNFHAQTNSSSRSTAVLTASMPYTRSEQANKLRRALAQLSLQLACVMSTCVLLILSGLLFATSMYGGLEQPEAGGTRFERMDARVMLVLMYVAVIDAALHVLALAVRANEAVLLWVLPSPKEERAASRARKARALRAVVEKDEVDPMYFVPPSVHAIPMAVLRPGASSDGHAHVGATRSTILNSTRFPSDKLDIKTLSTAVVPGLRSPHLDEGLHTMTRRREMAFDDSSKESLTTMPLRIALPSAQRQRKQSQRLQAAHPSRSHRIAHSPRSAHKDDEVDDTGDEEARPRYDDDDDDDDDDNDNTAWVFGRATTSPQHVTGGDPLHTSEALVYGSESDEDGRSYFSGGIAPSGRSGGRGGRTRARLGAGSAAA